jgi:predicted small secreted protein
MIRKILAGALVVCQCFMIAGCATIMSSSDQDVQIKSNPIDAQIRVDGMLMGKTPSLISLERKRRHELTIEKPGYQTRRITLSKKFNWWFAGNLIIGGLIGMIIDFASGAVFRLSPDEIDAKLEKIEGYIPSEVGVEMVEIQEKISANAAISSQLDQVKKLADMKSQGLITEEEFQIKKREVLNL